jgi:hypothetical protein
MSKMTWLDLYNFLHKKANDTSNLDEYNWTQQVMIHNTETGDEYPADTWVIANSEGKDRLVLVINDEEIFR